MNQTVKLSHLSYKLPNLDETLFSIKNFSINKSDKILLKGPSGKGKTTLLHIMAGFIKNYSGEVHLFGNNLSLMSEQALSDMRKDRSAFIFQKLNLINTLTPLENLELVAKGNFNKKEAIQILSELGLEAKINTISGQMSTGEQQRVACARAIFSCPEVIFADEPTSSLDDLNTKKVMEMLLLKNPSITMVVVSHDHRLDKYFSNTIEFENLVTK